MIARIHINNDSMILKVDTLCSNVLCFAKFRVKKGVISEFFMSQETPPQVIENLKESLKYAQSQNKLKRGKYLFPISIRLYNKECIKKEQYNSWTHVMKDSIINFLLINFNYKEESVAIYRLMKNPRFRGLILHPIQISNYKGSHQ